MPDVTIGKHPDGSPWVLFVDFGEGVILNGYGEIKVSTERIMTSTQALRCAHSLIEAAGWVDTKQSQKLEEDAQ